MKEKLLIVTNKLSRSHDASKRKKHFDFCSIQYYYKMLYWFSYMFFNCYRTKFESNIVNVSPLKQFLCLTFSIFFYFEF